MLLEGVSVRELKRGLEKMRAKTSPIVSFIKINAVKIPQFIIRIKRAFLILISLDHDLIERTISHWAARSGSCIIQSNGSSDPIEPCYLSPNPIQVLVLHVNNGMVTSLFFGPCLVES